MNNRYEHMLNKYRHRFIDEKMKDIDINFPEGPYLIKIHESKRMKMNQLNASFSFHKSHLTRIINQLVEKKYITKETDPDDLRGFIVEITEEGEIVAKKVLAVFFEWEKLIMSVISEDEEKLIQKIQQKMVQKLAQYYGEELPDEKNI